MTAGPRRAEPTASPAPRGTRSSMQTVTLNNGVAMPILGYGVYQIPPQDTEQAVADALVVGYRHLDTAAAYRNE